MGLASSSAHGYITNRTFTGATQVRCGCFPCYRVTPSGNRETWVTPVTHSDMEQVAHYVYGRTDIFFRHKPVNQRLSGTAEKREAQVAGMAVLLIMLHHIDQCGIIIACDTGLYLMAVHECRKAVYQ